MIDNTYALLKGLMAYLESITGITDIVGATGIYSSPPQDTPCPYVVVSVSSEPMDTKDIRQQKHVITCQVFSDKNSPGQALVLKALLHQALDRNEALITLDNSTLILLQQDGLSLYFREPDGVTWQAVNRFIAMTTED